MIVTRFVRNITATQYDGTNGAELMAAYVPDATLISDTGTTLTFIREEDQVPEIMNINDWILSDMGGVTIREPEIMARGYYPYPV